MTGEEKNEQLFACACCRRIWGLLSDERLAVAWNYASNGAWNDFRGRNRRRSFGRSRRQSRNSRTIQTWLNCLR